MRDDRLFLLHIRDSLRKVREFIEGESYESFSENRIRERVRMYLARKRASDK